MTRKDYILIANALRSISPICSNCGETKEYHLHKPSNECKPCFAPQEHHNFSARDEQHTLYIACALADDNPRFDRNHFLAVVRGERELQSRPPRS